jgi:hypothetical protein
VDRDECRRRLWQLRSTLKEYAERDPDQEVEGMALPVVDAVLAECRRFVENDPIVRTIEDVISPENVYRGEGIRAADMRIVVEQLLQAIADEPVVRRRSFNG